MPTRQTRRWPLFEEVPPNIRKYAVSEEDPEPTERKPRRYTVSRERMHPGAKSKRAK
jgi:hypothetical protein